MIAISKKFKWEMGHRLPFHKGPCRNIHGHSYSAEIILEGNPDENSMVLDYYFLARAVKPLIEKLDHSFVCDKDDLVMIDFLKNQDMKIFILPFYSTAENLAEYFLSELKGEFEKFDNIKRIGVRLSESAGTYAEKFLDLRN